jgi:hypothetical protein
MAGSRSLAADFSALPSEHVPYTMYVRNEEVLLRVKEQRNILHEISKRKANWIGHISRRNAFYDRLLKER